MQNFTIPHIYCPFPSAISPYADILHNHTLDWVRHFNLVKDEKAFEHLRASRFGWLAARAYPNAALDRLKIVADWNTWLFVLDDQCDEWGIGKHPEQLAALHFKCLEILSGSIPASDDVALVHAIYDIRMRIQPLMPLSWLTRFIQSAAEYFESTLWEAKNRAQGVWPESKTYIQMRPYTGGLYTDIDLIELTEGIALPLSVRKHTSIQQLTEITNNVVCWSNDIISLQKEFNHHDMHNLVLILHHRQQISLQAAINRVVKLIERQVRRFIVLENALPSFGAEIDKDVKKLIAVMRAWMRGNLDWSLESGRYLPVDRIESPEDIQPVDNWVAVSPA
ncbi:MAG: terpene synthase family protein [Methylobacter sp.]